jgi:hypothetical protein
VQGKKPTMCILPLLPTEWQQRQQNQPNTQHPTKPTEAWRPHPGNTQPPNLTQGLTPGQRFKDTP